MRTSWNPVRAPDRARRSRQARQASSEFKLRHHNSALHVCQCWFACSTLLASHGPQILAIALMAGVWAACSPRDALDLFQRASTDMKDFQGCLGSAHHCACIEALPWLDSALGDCKGPVLAIMCPARASASSSSANTESQAPRRQVPHASGSSWKSG